MEIKKDGISLYYIVKEKLLEMIESGIYKAGEQLPTEFELCQKFDVSRTTIRLALNQLNLEGHIYKIQGKGTFISLPKIEQSVSPYRGFKEQLRSRGAQIDTKVIQLTIVPADRNLVKILEINERDPVFKLERIRLVDDMPLLFSITYLPWKLTPGLTEEDCAGSLYDMMRTKFNVKPARYTESIEPILIDDSISKYLNTPVGAPAILLNSVTYTEGNIPVQYSHEIIRGDRAKFTVERDI